MGTFYKELQKKIGEQIIDIRDFRAYHVHRVMPNDTKDVKTLKVLCDEEYEYFHKQILEPRSDKGKILCELASDLWIYYEDSKEVLSFVKNENLLPQVDKRVAEFWIDEFTKRSSEDLHKEYGTNTIATGYGAILEYSKRLIMNERYEKIYSKTKDVDEIIKLFSENRKLLDGSFLPFDVTAIGEKARLLIVARA